MGDVFFLFLALLAAFLLSLRLPPPPPVPPAAAIKGGRERERESILTVFVDLLLPDELAKVSERLEPGRLRDLLARFSTP